MRTLPANHQAEAALPTLEPRYVIALKFSDSENLLTYSEDFSNAAWSQVNTPVITANSTDAPNGETTADTVEDNDGSSTESIYQIITIVDVTQPHVGSIFLYKDATGRATRFPRIRFWFSGSTTENNILEVDTATGESNEAGTGSTDVSFEVEDYDDNWWRVAITATSTDQSNTTASLQIYPARGASATWVNSSAATGSIIIWGAQISAQSSNVYVHTTSAARDSDETYLTSHDDALLPADIPAGDRIDSAIMPRGIAGATQKIDYSRGRFSIGTLTVRVADIDGDLTAQINTKLGTGEGLRRKRLRFYKGHKALTAWSDYATYLTYIIDSVEYLDGVYTFKCSDVQRQAKTEIFEPHQGVLTSTISADADEIPVTIADASTKFELVDHDSVYGSNASDEVGYIKIEDEVICHDGWTDANYDTLNVIERGALGTFPARHVVTEVEVSQRKKVTEYFYLEMTAPKMIYALLGGTLHGQSATLPDHWHAGIDAAYIKTADFTGIGSDLWDTSTDLGRLVRFMGMEPIPAKEFIEKELCIWLDCFMPVYADGTIGLRRYGGVLPSSGYLEYLDEYDIIRHGALTHDMEALTNNIAIAWNWIDRLGRFLKVNGLVDANSITKHGQADLKTYEFKGVFSGNNSDADIFNFFTAVRDRLSNPPLMLSISVTPENDVLEVGDTVRVSDPAIRDYNTNATIDRSFQIIQTRVDWVTGLVRLELFGGVAKSTEASITDSNVLIDNYYTAAGTELSTVLTISGGAVTANGTLNGGATATVFYYDGSLTINAGVTLTINRNVQLRIKGTLTVNGDIDLDGNASDGVIGSTTTGWSCQVTVRHVGQSGDVLPSPLIRYKRAETTSGDYPAGVPVFNLLNPDGTGINGLPDDLSGVPGTTGAGARVRNIDSAWPPTYDTAAAGGAGGVGGGGLIVVCRGMAMGVSSGIDCSGTDGTAGSSATGEGLTVRGQTGSGGFPGGVLVLIDGDYSAPIFDATNVTANKGAQAVPGTVDLYVNDPGALSNGEEGYGQQIADSFNYWEACTRIQYIPEAIDRSLWLPEDERRSSNPRREVTDLLISNLQLQDGLTGGAMYGAAYGGGLFVIAGLWSTDTRIYTSPDGRLWTERSNPGTASTDGARGMTYGGGNFVIVLGNLTTYGAILYSSDGITWSKVTPTGANSLSGVAYGDGVYVAVGFDDGTDGDLFTATSLATWTERANPKAFDLRAVCYSTELSLWIAGGQPDGTDAYLITASDPTSTWTERSNPVNGTIRGIAAGNGIVVAVGSNAAGTGPYIIYSSDGITWTQAGYPITDEYLLQVRFFDGVFYAVGTYDDAVVGSTLWTSEDGASWRRVANSASNSIEDITFDGSCFVAVTSSGNGDQLVSPRVEAV